MGALQPVMFPDIEGPDFVRSEDVVAIAERVLERHGRVGAVGRLHPVAEAIRDEELHVLYLRNEKPVDLATEELTHETAGKCIKAPRVWHDVTGYHFVIWVRGYFWDRADDDYREGLILHELLHIDVDRDKNEQLKLSTRKHDVEDFTDVVRHYGPIAGDGRAYLRAAALHDSPLRPLQDLAEETGTDITIEAGGRSATIRGRKGAVDDETDVRPTGEINADALRGEAERASDDA